VLTSWKSTARAIGWAVVFLMVAFMVALSGTWFAAAALVGGFEPAADWLSVAGPAQIALQGITLTLAGLLATYLIGIRVLGLDFASLRWKDGASSGGSCLELAPRPSRCSRPF
jgi:hypothetical protein